MIWNKKILRAGFQEAKKINAQYGTSYYFANRLFPKEIREAVHVLYAFFRIPDNIVDDIKDPEEARQKLVAWEEKWSDAYRNYSTLDPVLYASSFVFHTYQIPWQYSESFFRAMTQDLSKSEYASYQELEDYMYGSAAVVGLMLTHIIGLQDPAALGYAKQLGFAMQLTNFLRDIKEDYIDKKRVYMPQDELKQFGLSSDTIAKEEFSPAFVDFMTFQINRARALYREADKGIPLLDKKGQRAVRVASRLYEAILKKIEQQDKNIFLGRARTNKFEKLMILITSL